MDVQDLLELVLWIGVVVTGSVARVVHLLLEWLFVAIAWLALAVVGTAMAFQRGGLPWTDRSDARATSR